MKKTLITLAFALFLLQQAFPQNYDNKSVTGSWMGKLEVSALQLRIIFNLSTVEKDSLVATMDSPDQGAKGIKLGVAKLDGKIIKIAAPAILGEYNGTVTNDTLIKGTWKQAGRELPLDLTRLKTSFTLNRPQEPKPPFPYKSEEVTFVNKKENFTLSGTLTIPDGGGPFPAVVLITGSGAQNRNEELLGHKPFLVIADYLSRNGIAVLRFDDRGVGKSKGSLIGVTTANFADDAASAVEFLETHPAINHNLIGLAGHSEGGLIAPMVAATSNRIAFIISLSGPGVTGEKLLYKQSYDITVASGVDAAKAKEGVDINHKLYAVLKKEKDNEKAREKMTKIYKESLDKNNTPPEEALSSMKQFQASITGITDPWFRYFLVTDPAPFWKKVRCPVLALNGEKDLQVDAGINLPAIEKAVKSGGNDLVKTVALPDLNHLYQHCKTGLPSEYGEIEETFAPEVLQIMKDWILNLKASQPAF